MSYCMLVGPEQSFSVLNVYPMSFARYGGNPIRIETCGRLVHLLSYPVCLGDKFLGFNNVFFQDREKTC